MLVTTDAITTSEERTRNSLTKPPIAAKDVAGIQVDRSVSLCVSLLAMSCSCTDVRKKT